MAHTYTPGLRVTERTVLRKRRILPLPGKVLADVGDTVKADTVVARAELPGDVYLVNAVSRLGVSAEDLPRYLLKREGDPVQEAEILAQTQPWIRWFQSRLESPVTGTLESVSTVTGQIVLRTPPKPVEVSAYIDGTVSDRTESEGVEIETTATFIQGIFGVGGEANGTLHVASRACDEDLHPDQITEEHRGRVVVGGALASGPVLRRAVQMGLAGLVVGGFHDSDLRELVGRDLGVAITGAEEVGLTLIMTEGFGRIPMAERTFQLLRSRNGERASINGATQIRAGVMRPEIVIPWRGPATGPARPASADPAGLEVGSAVRVIRQPWFGRLGRVAALPARPVQIDTEAVVRVAEVEFADGQRRTVPRANLEMIEP